MKQKGIAVEILIFAGIIIFVAALAVFVNLPSNPKTSSLPVLKKAPELTGTQQWINSQPLALEKLKGKVVLIDFWTYSCINCIRTLPYMNDWHAKYADKGLVIIGVHTPEFEFEKDYGNVKQAVEKYGIKYPVVQDNDYGTWRAYENNYWPRKYLIDKDGNIRYDHIGEGGYQETEEAIQELLREIRPDLKINMTEEEANTDFSQIGTPEIYLGYKFARAPLGNPEGFSPGNIVDYKAVNITAVNIVYLSGQWKNDEDKIIAVNNSKLFLAYKANKANIVAGGTSIIKTLLDGRQLNKNETGADTGENGVILINENRLYNIISTSGYEAHLLGIEASPGFELYTFTFG